MNANHILDAIGYINDAAIHDASVYKRNSASRSHILTKRAAIAACLCLVVALATAVVYRPQENTDFVSAPTLSGKADAPHSYGQALLYQGNYTEGTAVLLSTASTSEEGLTLFAAENEDPLSVLHVAGMANDLPNTEPMTLEAAQEYAYMDLSSASPDLAEAILEARETIIYSKSWVADGYSGFIEDTETGEKVPLPSFSQLFPGWDIPVIENKNSSITEDGLGADVLYGIQLKIMDIAKDHLICTPVESMNQLDQDQRLTIFLPTDYTVGLPDLHIGDTVFVSYFGKDCSVKTSEIYANAILKNAP